MASEIRVNSLTNRSGLSTVSITDAGVVVAGMVTATSFSGPLTGDVTGNITATNGTFSGDVTVGGTLTYDDVTNIDSVGVVTARNGLRVTGGNVGIGTDSTDRQLAVYHATQGTIEIKSSDTGQSSLWFSDISDGNVGGVYYEHSNNAMVFRANDAERLRITSDGTITQIGKSGAAASTAIDPLSSFVLNDDEARLQLCATNTGNNAAGLILSNESKHYVIHQRGPNSSNSFEIGYLDDASPTDINNQSTPRLTITTGGNVGIGSETPGGILDIYHATQNTILNVKSGDAGSVINIIDPSQRSSIEQSGTTLKIISDTGAEFANSDIRLQVDGSTKMLVDSYGCIRVGNTHAQTTSGNTKRIALGAKGSIWGWTSGNINGALTLADNYYWDGGNNRAIEADNAAYLSLRSGSLRFGTTDSTPSAGGVTGLTEKFRVDTSGNLLLGQGHTTASDLAGGFTKRLAVEGTSAANSSIGLTRNANDDNPPYIYFGKSRGTSAGSNTRALNNDHLGMVNFAGSKGTGAFGDSVNLRVNAEENFSSSSTPGRFSVWTTPTNSTSPLNSFQINSAGAITAPRNVAWSYSRQNNGASWGANSSATYPNLQYRTPLPLFGTSATNYDTHNALSTFTSGSGTGIKFTAPVGGKYLVMLNMSSVKNNTESDWGSIGLMRNTTAQASTGSLDYMLDTMYFPDSTSSNNQLGWGGSVIIGLSQNDYIVPYTMSVDKFSSDNQFYFQGYLLG